MRFIFVIKRSDHKCSTPLYWEVVEARHRQASVLGVLFLQEQVRDLRVQEFLRELVVGVATPSDLGGSILVKIFHSVKDMDVNQVCSILETNLPCLRLLLSLSLVFIYLACLYCSYLYMLDILVLNCYMLGIICSHLYSTKRVIVAPQLLI